MYSSTGRPGAIAAEKYDMASPLRHTRRTIAPIRGCSIGSSHVRIAVLLYSRHRYHPGNNIHISRGSVPIRFHSVGAALQLGLRASQDQTRRSVLIAHERTELFNQRF
jgi:hypothetical protein